MALTFPVDTTNHAVDAFGQVGYHMHDHPVIHHQLRTLRTSQWRFNVGHLLLDSVGSNTLTNVNSVSQTTGDFVEGNASAEYPVGEAYLEAADDPSLTSVQSFSFSVWVKIGVLGSYQAIFSKDSQAKREYSLVMDQTNVAFTLIGRGDTLVDVANLSGTTISAGVWYHYVMTHNIDTKTTSLYTNGQLDDNWTYTFTAAGSDEPVRIGGDGLIGNTALSNDSKVDNVIWFAGTVLTAEQVQFLYDHPGFY